MRFIVMGMATKESESAPPPKPEAFVAMQQYNEELAKAGVLLDLSGLQPTSKGARIEYSGKKRTITDGPFTEAKEVVGGFAIIQAKSKEHAIEITKKFLKVAGDGECELRQIYEMPA